jgi:hypothetical protein
MARPPRGGHKDGNHDEVVKGLRDFGVLVKSLAGVGEGCGDILCGYRGVLTVLEIKDPESSRGTKLSQKEAEFVATFPRVYVVTSADEAISVVVEAARPSVRNNSVSAENGQASNPDGEAARPVSRGQE